MSDNEKKGSWKYKSWTKIIREALEKQNYADNRNDVTPYWRDGFDSQKAN